MENNQDLVYPCQGVGYDLNEHINEDLCLDLLRGFLTADERDRALAHAAACAACEKLFALSAAQEERVRARGALSVQPGGEIAVEPYLQNEPAASEIEWVEEDRPESTTPEYAAKARQPAVPSWKRFLRPAFGMAAVAAAIVVLFLVIPKQDQDQSSSLLRPMADLGEEIHLRSDARTGESDNLQKGIEAYAGDDLRRAVDLLENAEATGQLDNLRRVYLGSACARLGEYEDAVNALKTVSFISIPDPWGGEGRWTLYVSLRALGRDEEAQSILVELAREPGQFGDRAREVLSND